MEKAKTTNKLKKTKGKTNFKFYFYLFNGLFFLLNIGIVYADTTTNTTIYPFDLFSLFVEGVFGNILLSGAGLIIIFAIIMMKSKVSPMLMSYILALFTCVFAVMYFGGWVALPFLVLSAIYFVRSILSWVDSLNGNY